MKVDSIIFDCPLLYRNSINVYNTRKIVATNIEDYLLNSEVFLVNRDILKFVNKIFLVTVELDGHLFVIQKSRKLKKLTKIANKLSSTLNAIITIVKAENKDGHIELTPVYITDCLIEDNTTNEDIIDEEDPIEE